VKRIPRIGLLLLCLIISSTAFADAPVTAQQQASQYSLGDQTLTPSIGLFIPLFVLDPNTGASVPFLVSNVSAGEPAQLSLGGIGSLSWAAYVTPQIRVGLDVATDFAWSPNGNALIMVPFIAKAAYIFSFYPFEVPLSFGVGMNIEKYVNQTMIDLLLRPGTGFYWIFNSSWAFGLNLNYMFDMQFATVATNSRIGNFLEVSLGALYHF
jgi:hypothetical protein